MNKERRQKIKAVIDKIGSIQQMIIEISEELEQIRDDEQEAFDNMPEGIQESARGEKMQNAIEIIEDVMSELDLSYTFEINADNLHEAAE